MKTLGEILALRSLDQKQQAGVPHYKPGQHYARLLDKDSALLTFVDAGGQVCLIPCVREKAGWHHLSAAVRVGQATMNVHVLTSANFTLSDQMVEALDEAVARARKRQGARARRTRPATAR